MLFDTEFLIRYSGQRGRAQKLTTDKFVALHLDAPLYSSRVCWTEFAAGCETLALVETTLAPFTILEIDRHIGWQASRISRLLQRTGQRIGDNDVWIAATALAFHLPLVTRNRRHFDRVAGLALETY